MKIFKITMLFFITCTMAQHTTVNAATNFANLQNQTTNSQLTPVLFNTAQQQSLNTVSNFTSDMRKKMYPIITPQKSLQKNSNAELTSYYNTAIAIGNYINLTYKGILTIFENMDSEFNSKFDGAKSLGEAFCTDQDKLEEFVLLKGKQEIVLNSLNGCIGVIDESLNAISCIATKFVSHEDGRLAELKKQVAFVESVKQEFNSVNNEITWVTDGITKEIDEIQKKMASKKSQQVDLTPPKVQLGIVNNSAKLSATGEKQEEVLTTSFVKQSRSNIDVKQPARSSLQSSTGNTNVSKTEHSVPNQLDQNVNGPINNNGLNNNKEGQQSNTEPTEPAAKAKEESKGVFFYITNIFSNAFKTVKSWFGFTKGKNQ